MAENGYKNVCALFKKIIVEKLYKNLLFTSIVTIIRKNINRPQH